ncbi:MAG: hypothetical protein AAFQ82_10050, partial [Myxococcota bacterium]
GAFQECGDKRFGFRRPDGAIVWITPEETRKSRPVPESGALGVRLSAPAGMNRAVVVFTSEAIGREGIKAGFDGEFPETWERIERDFEVVTEGSE